jgi:hypothetical protein
MVTAMQISKDDIFAFMISQVPVARAIHQNCQSNLEAPELNGNTISFTSDTAGLTFNTLLDFMSRQFDIFADEQIGYDERTGIKQKYVSSSNFQVFLETKICDGKFAITFTDQAKSDFAELVKKSTSQSAGQVLRCNTLAIF